MAYDIERCFTGVLRITGVTPQPAAWLAGGGGCRLPTAEKIDGR